MNRVANVADVPPREYRSELRAQQAGETRARVLDATVRVMARGMASVSIPAVAREAGVSIPTVYRHFATKSDLLDAVYPHLVRRAGLNQLVVPASLDTLRDGVLTLLGHLDGLDDLARAAMAGPAAQEARHLGMPRRLEMTRRLAESVVPRLSEADRDRIARLLVILTSSSALRTWGDHLGVSTDQVADDIEWVVRAAIAAATPEQGR